MRPFYTDNSLLLNFYTFTYPCIITVSTVPPLENHVPHLQTVIFPMPKLDIFCQQVKSPVPGMGCFLLAVGQRDPIDLTLQISQAISKAIGYSP